MARIVITYDPSGVQKMLTALSGLRSPDLVQTRLEEGVHRAGRYLLPIVRKTLQEQTNIKPRGVSSRTKGFVPAGMRGVYQIAATGSGVYIAEVQGTKGSKRDSVRWSPRQHWKLQARDSRGRWGQIAGGTEGGVTSDPWGVAHRFKRSFVSAKGRYYAVLPTAKGSKSKGRLLYGPAVWKELVKGATLAVFEAQAPALMQREVEAKLTRLMP
ncbi:hypothetical protein ABB55_08495 [Prosthecomicrobium hirschii]|uniref:Uncharacterized protein n=1 Tax=Prosthecodimorpha hirschii TaxID=665126 RepID=A0A0N8GER6_9HYPH|nr:hypothetical protein [Prosthecomicrobium hirschii]KPL52265.1 hypothetical protein ABB55_08495 [Prosthecomicrobium hirschii]